jgi:hypothetical protein
MEKEKVSRVLFIGIIAVGLGSANILLFMGIVNQNFKVIGFAWIPMLIAAVTLLILFYKMWEAIQDGHARTTPGKAIGFLLIPIFNFYWSFQALWGFAVDYNKLINRYSLNIPRLPEGLFLAYTILVFTTWIPKIGLLLLIVNYFIGIVMVSKICDGINSLPDTSELENKA